MILWDKFRISLTFREAPISNMLCYPSASKICCTALKKQELIFSVDTHWTQVDGNDEQIGRTLLSSHIHLHSYLYLYLGEENSIILMNAMVDCVYKHNLNFILKSSLSIIIMNSRKNVYIFCFLKTMRWFVIFELRTEIRFWTYFVFSKPIEIRKIDKAIWKFSKGLFCRKHTSSTFIIKLA